MIHDSVDDYNNAPILLSESSVRRGYSSVPITARSSSTDDNARFCLASWDERDRTAEAALRM